MTNINKSFLTLDQAKQITDPFYDSLNRPAEKDVSGLLAEACLDDYQSFHTNEEFLTREQLADVFTSMGRTIPDLTWEVADMHVLGGLIIVRGRATGTPVTEFWGAAPTGKAFKTMAIDIFSVRDGKLATCFHVENWMTALEQLKL